MIRTRFKVDIGVWQNPTKPGGKGQQYNTKGKISRKKAKEKDRINHIIGKKRSSWRASCKTITFFAP